jgi:hypothetical protein
MEETNIVIESDEKTLSMVKDILNSGTPDTVRALKMNVYSYHCLFLGERERNDNLAIEKRDKFKVITGGVK